MTILPLTFMAKYKLDANQQLDNDELESQRNTRIAYWCQYTANGIKMSNAFEAWCKTHHDGDYYMTFEIPDRYSIDFESDMITCGQHFDVIG